MKQFPQFEFLSLPTVKTNIAHINVQHWGLSIPVWFICTHSVFVSKLLHKLYIFKYKYNQSTCINSLVLLFFQSFVFWSTVQNFSWDCWDQHNMNKSKHWTSELHCLSLKTPELASSNTFMRLSSSCHACHMLMLAFYFCSSTQVITDLYGVVLFMILGSSEI